MIPRGLSSSFSIAISLAAIAITSASPSAHTFGTKLPLTDNRSSAAFASNVGDTKKCISPTAIYATKNQQPSSFLSTNKAKVQFASSSNAPANLSSIDSLLLTLTSDRFSLLVGSLGIVLLLLNRLFTFPEGEDAVIYEANRSRIDLLGVFAAGSVLLNGITKLDVTSVQAERVALEGTLSENVVWNSENSGDGTTDFVDMTEWALSSLIKCSPARTVVLLSNMGDANSRWEPIASMGVLPSNEDLQHSLPDGMATPILDRMKRYDATAMNTKGGSVAGSSFLGRNRGPKESYLPTLQALPGRVEFTYLSSNTQEVLVLPVPTKSAEGGGRCFAIVLGGDAAKSFAPKDIAWCREISSWIGDSLDD